VLPTLAVILWAYGMYALFAFIFQRKGGTSRSQGRGRWFSVCAWTAFALGLGLFLWCGYASNKQNQHLRLAGFLGTVYAEGLSGQVDKLDYPALKAVSQRPGEQPVYALLHPGTPSGQLAPAKKLIRPRPARIVRKRHTTAVHEKSPRNTKVNKAGKHSARKAKRAAKSRGKKKRSSALRRRQIHAG
jgi:hypothetical protein